MRRQHQLSRIIELNYILGRFPKSIGDINRELPSEYRCHTRTTMRDLQAMQSANMVRKTPDGWIGLIRMTRV